MLSISRSAISLLVLHGVVEASCSSTCLLVRQVRMGLIEAFHSAQAARLKSTFYNSLELRSLPLV